MNQLEMIEVSETCRIGTFRSTLQARRIGQSGARVRTCGDSLWSDDEARAVQITHLWVDHDEEDEREGRDWAELRVVFDTDSWNCREYGLIYTDTEFLSGLRSVLNILGLDSSDVGYSEQGMQGDNYVSLDVGPKFLKSWKSYTNKA